VILQRGGVYSQNQQKRDSQPNEGMKGGGGSGGFCQKRRGTPSLLQKTKRVRIGENFWGRKDEIDKVEQGGRNCQKDTMKGENFAR